MWSPLPARAALLGCAVSLCALPARAQNEAEIATRARLLEAAQQARESGDHPRALELAQGAGRIQMTPSLRFFLGREQRDLRRYAAALGSAQQCVRDVEQSASIPQRDLLLAECANLRREVEPLVGSVTVVPPSPVPEGLRVTVEGEELRAALLGLPYVVSAGAVLVEAQAPGQRPFRFEARVSPGADVRVSVAFPAEMAPVRVAPRAPVAQPSPVAPVALLGVGAALVVAGGAFYAVGNTPSAVITGTSSGCVMQPGGWRCPDTLALREAWEGVQRYDGLAVGSFVAGGVGIAAGALWLVLARPSVPARVEALWQPGAGGLAARVRF